MALQKVKSALRGSLYGLAVGDALGAPYETLPRGSYHVSGEMNESPPELHEGLIAPLRPGTWTDDTSLALCLSSSIIEHNGFKWDDVAMKMLSWYREGYMSPIGSCFDIGKTTRESLDLLHENISRGSALSLPKAGESSSHGNGSLMRLSPVPVFYHSKPLKAYRVSELQSQITHCSVICIESCRLAAAQILGFIELARDESISAEEKKKRVLEEASPSSELEFSSKEIRDIRCCIWKGKSVDEIRTNGAVHNTHEAALWALWNSSNFEEGMLLLLPLGSDVDTVCAVYGQFAGALYGFDAIPRRWISALQHREFLESMFDVLVDKAMAKY